MSNEKFISHEGELEQIENSDLDCKDCIYRHKDIGTCVMYQREKPGKVLYGKKCDKKSTKAS